MRSRGKTIFQRVVMAAVFALVAAGCSSSSDSTTTLVPGETTTTSVTDATTTTAAFAITVEIVEPPSLTTVVATIDRGDGTLAAPVRLAADVEIPSGETVTVSWNSDVDGDLGSGSVIDAELSNDGTDVVSHRVTVTVTSSGGGGGSAFIDVIVRVPSN